MKTFHHICLVILIVLPLTGKTTTMAIDLFLAYILVVTVAWCQNGAACPNGDCDNSDSGESSEMENSKTQASSGYQTTRVSATASQPYFRHRSPTEPPKYIFISFSPETTSKCSIFFLFIFLVYPFLFKFF